MLINWDAGEAAIKKLDGDDGTWANRLLGEGADGEGATIPCNDGGEARGNPDPIGDGYCYHKKRMINDNIIVTWVRIYLYRWHTMKLANHATILQGIRVVI